MQLFLVNRSAQLSPPFWFSRLIIKLCDKMIERAFHLISELKVHFNYKSIVSKCVHAHLKWWIFDEELKSKFQNFHWHILKWAIFVWLDALKWNASTTLWDKRFSQIDKRFPNERQVRERMDWKGMSSMMWKISQQFKLRQRLEVVETKALCWMF